MLKSLEYDVIMTSLDRNKGLQYKITAVTPFQCFLLPIYNPPLLLYLQTEI